MRYDEVVGYTYEASFHCLDCARKRFGDALDNEETADNEGNTLYPCIAGQNDGSEHGETCGDCGEIVYEAWCEGCAECAPKLTVTVEDDETDPFAVKFFVYGAEDNEAIERWIHMNGGSIDGSSWESCEGMAYAHGSRYPGCVAAWKKEGYDLDQSEFSGESHLEWFDNHYDLDRAFADFRNCCGGDACDAELESEIRADLAVYQAATYSVWRADQTEESFDVWRDAQVAKAKAARAQEARLQAEAAALQMKLAL